MEQEEKIYALIVHAQESQKFVLEFREDAKRVLNSLPEAAKRAVSAPVGEVVAETKKRLQEATEATERALEQAEAGLLKAAERVNKASVHLSGRRLWGVFIHAVTLVVVMVALGGLGYFGWCKVLEHQITERQARLKVLEEEIDRAEAVNRRLEKAQLTDCEMKNGRKRLCIRVNSTLGAFYGGKNQNEEYRVIFGY